MSKFKVGDKVRMVKQHSPSYPIGSIQAVTAVTHKGANTSTGVGVWIEGDEDVWDGSYFELVTAAPAPTPTVPRTTADLEEALKLEIHEALGVKRAALYDAAKVLKKAGLTVEADRLEAIAKGVELSRSALQ